MLPTFGPKTHINRFSKYFFRMIVLTIALFVFQNESFAQQGTLTDDATFPANESALTVQGSSAPEGSAVSFIKFKLTPNLPPATPGGFVAKATLTLYVGSLNTSGSFNVYRVTNSWGESDTTAPTYDEANPVVVGVQVTAAGSYVTVDLTALAQQWLGTDGLGTGGVPNYGIALVANTTTTAFSFDSKESTTTSHPARLAVLLNHAATADIATDFTGTLAGDVTGTQNATVVSSVGSQSAASVANSTIAANAATNTNTPGTIVKRDASGNFSAGTITASLNGNATSSTDATTANAVSSSATVNGNQVNGGLTNATIAGNKVTGEVANATNATTAVTANALSSGATVPGSQVSGNIPGKAASITGTINGNQVSSTVAEAMHATNADNATNATTAGNASAVTNGVYTVGNQSIGGNKSFTSPIAGNITGNAATATNAMNATNATIAKSVVRAARDADIAAPADGQVYYNTTSNVFKVFDGPTLTWKIVDAGNAATLSSSATISGNQVNGGLTNATIAGSAVTGNIAASQISGNITNATIAGYVTKVGDTMTGMLNLPANGLQAGTNQLVLAAGNVGIGTALPNQQLEITKNFRLPATTSTTGIIYAGASRFIHNYHHATADGGNTFIGINAGNLSMGSGGGNSGSYNVGVGVATLSENTTGKFNTAIGFSALGLNTSGFSNTAIGNQALVLNTTGNFNTSIGDYSLQKNTTGESNTAVGYFSQAMNVTGYGNTTIGVDSGELNITGNNNTAVGLDALYSNLAGHNSVALGFQAGNWETSSNHLFIDSYDRGNLASGRSMALIHGVFDPVVAQQSLDFNAGLSTFAGVVNVNGWLEGGFDSSGISPAANSGYAFSRNFSGEGNEVNFWNTINDAARGGFNFLQTGASSQTTLMTILGNGNVGIRTSSPAERLEVEGNLKVSGAGNGLIFADGTTQKTAASPGGTIAGVTAGTGLTGGGTSGNVTLNVNQSVVAFRSDLATEVSTRQSADTNLQNTLNIETGDRTAADAALQTTVDRKVAKAGDTMSGTLNLPTNGLVVGSTQLVLSGSKVGIGTDTPQTKLQINGGSVYVGSAGQGIVLKSPDGSVCKLLTIDDTGAMVLSAITCP